MGAPKPHNRKNHNNPARRRLLVIALAVFLLVDVGLVAFALTATKPASSAGTVAAVPTSSPETVEPAVTPTPTVEPVDTTPTLTVAPTRVIAALNETTAWRALTGACPTTAAAPEITTDSGVNWEAFNAATETGATSILSIDVVDDAEASLITLDDIACAPQVVTTFVAGDAWRLYPERVAAEWYIDPSTSGTVHTPTGDVAAPCAAVATLAALDNARAAVLCLDASVVTTQDGGFSWSAPSSIPGAAAITATAGGYAVAVVNPTGCVGAVLVNISENAEFDSTASGTCFSSAVNAGETALSAADDGTIWLWVGDSFARSLDGGASWV
ncbi:hypothetical protein [Cryobacterium sp. TMT4-31]|uniref:hypothetical protein n=1 Tax=Cryobacterium sp. TMT4-31 TaxID=1259259 RepID=UPI00106AFFB6|nr:hypothetical protein [Cryobacterium sp. TMT4-31]TFC91997.1 hypothetical protein E3T19_02885 [Cryobacterium sp. TMT4-31]